MITDDPGTPGNHKWEINLGWSDERTPGVTLYGLPLLDANYGVGDDIELTYEAPWAVVRSSDESQRSGPGESLFGAKWRFFDAGEHGWQASMYPQYTFLDPGSNSARRGLAESATTLYMPVEVARDFGPIAVDLDFGHIFSNETESRGWSGGCVLGKEVRKGWELDLEVHVQTSEDFDRTEVILNAGTRIDLSEHLTLMLALGRDLSDTLQPKVQLLSYVGFQIRL
jgi:hypothetical protein